MLEVLDLEEILKASQQCKKGSEKVFSPKNITPNHQRSYPMSKRLSFILQKLLYRERLCETELVALRIKSGGLICLWSLRYMYMCSLQMNYLDLVGEVV